MRRTEHVNLEEARAAERALAAAERAERRRREESGLSQAAALSAEVARRWASASTWLVNGLVRAPRSVADAELYYRPAPFDPGPLAVASPPPERPPLVRRLLGLDSDYRSAVDAHRSLEAERAAALTAATEAHLRLVAGAEAAAAARSRRLPDWHGGYLEGHTRDVAAWLKACMEAEPTFDGSPPSLETAFFEESALFVVDYDVPPLSALPAEAGYRYIRSTGRVTPQERPPAQRRAAYGSLLAQITLRMLHSLFTDDTEGRVQVVAFNAFLSTTEPATGRPVRSCVVSVRVTRERFAELHLKSVEPIACLRGLGAAVSRSPDELSPVRPLVRLDTADRRFVDEHDVLSTLDERPNLLALSPGEFESLVTNLFARMGLDTHLTQPSRDGGVDCVAFDMRPVLGGKVVIQAKRYTDTVGVSAVRDLYGTMLNEGASKGILVTTSGYGPAAFDFAAGKPIELLSGANLLSLLADFAGLDARIEPVDVGAGA